ncbi:carbohydrate ABC transporter permease [Paenibacillus sp.]|uniref:carbohydrate ABC transporter permease n=1 Tax=Paenibacillus sp. TaxID=58172 RepID=UPI002810B802|nr:carbohydrate ABC transporter permease [Paenibacillus sp.]
MKPKLFDIVNMAFLTIVSLVSLLPLLLVLIVSFTEERAIKANGYSFFPEQMTTAAYRMLFGENSLLLQSYLVSIVVTVVGTTLAVAITGMAGYTLSASHIRYRNALALFFFVTMVFNSGLVPWYLVSSGLGLRNNLWALIVPSLLFNPFNLFLVRNYMKQIPDSLIEAARIDGANDLFIAFRIFFPLSLPVMATITLFYGIGYWNNWFNAIMLVDDQRLYPLQYLLFKLNSEINMISQMQAISGSAVSAEALPTESVKMATAIMTIGPIVLFYPFLQKYFIRGLLIGSVKE